MLHSELDEINSVERFNAINQILEKMEIFAVTIQDILDEIHRRTQDKVISGKPIVYDVDMSVFLTDN